jgi:DnaJ-class molecular chaperone
MCASNEKTCPSCGGTGGTMVTYVDANGVSKSKLVICGTCSGTGCVKK